MLELECCNQRPTSVSDEISAGVAHSMSTDSFTCRVDDTLYSAVLSHGWEQMKVTGCCVVTWVGANESHWLLCCHMGGSK